ncbi:TadE/TadG family type IV pilus assembly protein [Alloalcanivorax xenomutans]|uniref:TadE/TadG family type IV pilus assembly protein n=1 Tax=Alloalcanivorax xenomutans TaxID=1094342 RepID=UPI003BAD3065
MIRKERGAVALEFLVLFPMIISLIYAAGVYGVLFSWQVRMQIAVDRATASVMSLDRNTADDPKAKAEELAQVSMNEIVPDFIGNAAGACEADESQVTCKLAVALMESGCGGNDSSSSVASPRQLGFFGGFPPMPSCLEATAKVAY